MTLTDCQLLSIVAQLVPLPPHPNGCTLPPPP